MSKKENELEKLLNEITRTKELANADPNDCSYQTRQGRSMAIYQAKEDLPGLLATYKRKLIENSAVYFINGPKDKVRQFAQLALELPTTLAMPARALYKKLAEMIEPQFGDSRQFIVDQYSRVLANIKELGEELGLHRTATIDLRSFPTLYSIDESTTFLRDIIRESNGDDLNQLWMVHELVREALDIRYKEPVVQVLVLGAEMDEARNLSRGFSRLGSIVDIGAEDEVSDEYVREVFGYKPKQKKTSKQENENQTTQQNDNQENNE